MTFPNHPGKHAEEALFTPAESLSHRDDESHPVPEALVLCYHDGLLARIAEEYEVAEIEVDAPWGTCYLLSGTDGRVGVVGGFGVGAPQTALAMEEFVVRGVKKFVSVGHAGSLQPDVRVGDLVVVERALRDEGTSHHYLAPGKWAEATPELVEALADACAEADEPYRRGSTWTIDAPYRETGAEIEAYREEGVLTVDMEAAATFAVARHRGVAAGALFTVSDHLDAEWEPRFEETLPHLLRAFDRAVEALSVA